MSLRDKHILKITHLGGDRSAFRGGNRGGDFGIRGGFGKRNGGGDYCASSRGFRGGGGFRVGRGGGLRDRGGDINLAVKNPVFKEIQDGLQLLVISKKAPTLEETKRQLRNFHSRIRRPTGKDSTSTAHVLLFTDVESLEAAKVKLDQNPNVEATDYMGMKSAKKRVTFYSVILKMHFGYYNIILLILSLGRSS